MRDQGAKGKEKLGFIGGRENQTLMSNTEMTRQSHVKQRRTQTGETH